MWKEFGAIFLYSPKYLVTLMQFLDNLTRQRIGEAKGDKVKARFFFPVGQTPIANSDFAESRTDGALHDRFRRRFLLWVLRLHLFLVCLRIGTGL